MSRKQKKLPYKEGYYVYTLVNTLDNKVFYVGMSHKLSKGCSERISTHLSRKGTRVKKRVDEIWDAGGWVNLTIIADGLTKKEALQLEKKTIEQYGYDQLVNNPWALHRKGVPKETTSSFNGRRMTSRTLPRHQ